MNGTENCPGTNLLRLLKIVEGQEHGPIEVAILAVQVLVPIAGMRKEHVTIAN
ncbi:hypothetical protein [Bacillus sp. WP8]|uniref:hypothetical protein n=1 Tax=Bacillus sp. WP8 TaxID=756828 RepID=UPI001642746F|nr:hypothetical protein [Bacillus sp. WP8]